MAWLPFAKLEITDGTTAINLLNQQDTGFCIVDWQPAIQDLKAGGTWADAPTADESELIVAQLANVEDRFVFDVSAATPNELIGHLRDLRAMLLKARQYTTTTWQDTPVYLAAQGYGDSNVRYTRVKNWRTPADGFPYGPPMWATIQGNAIEDFEIIIEHGAWSENAPGVGTATEISAVEAYDGRNLGNVDSSGTRVPTTESEVYLSNKRNVANLTDIYYYDASGPVYSANLMDAALPFSMLPAVPAVGDILYFGSDSAIANSGPFCSLVFDIGTAGAGYTGVWEVRLIAGWTALTVQDNTNAAGAMTGIAFDTTGVNSVHWEQPASWPGTTAINGITGWWVRYRITGVPGALTVPTQQNRDIYSITWSYTEVQSTDVLGDIPSLIKISLSEQSDRDGVGGSAPDLYETRVVCGLRSYSRGSDFVAFLNIGSVTPQNPAGVAITVGANVLTLTGASQYVVSEYYVYGPLGVEAIADRIIFTFSSALMPDYYGKFHVYFRGRKTGTNTISARLKAIIGSGGIESYSDTLYVTTASTDFTVFDLGVIDIPAGKLNSDETGDETKLVIQSGADGATGDLRYMDLILIPIDEWAGDFSLANDNDDGVIQNDTYLTIDGVERPKDTLRSILWNDSDEAVSFYIPISNGEPILQANAQQRLWFFFMRSVYSAGVFLRYESRFESSYKVLIERVQRYWSMRGEG